MSRLLVLVALAICVASVVALPIHHVDQALIQHDDLTNGAAAPVPNGAPAAPHAPVAAAPRTSHQCRAAGGDCVNTASGAQGLCAAPGVLRDGLCNGGASVKCCVTRPASPTANNAAAPPRKNGSAAAKTNASPAKTTPAAPTRHCAGHCADSTRHTCSTGFQTGKCNGAATMQCCTGTVGVRALPNQPAKTNGSPAKTNGNSKTTPATPNTPTPAPNGPTPAAPTLDKCVAVKGTCVDSDKNTCSTPFRSGLCKGSAATKCCVGTVSANANPATPNTNPATPAAPTGPVSFAKLKSCYPQGEAEEVKARIGGAINASWITNTCAIRMSHTLNCAGKKVPQSGGESIRGKNNDNYIFRVKQLGPLVRKFFGNGHTVTAPTGRGVPLSALAGKKGIIMFDTTGAWDDATGHFDLWDGSSMVEGHHVGQAKAAEYFGLSRAITIWEMP